MKTVWVNTPLRDDHRRWLEEAAAGRCRLVCSAEPCPEAEALIGALPVEDLGTLPQLQWFHLVWAGVDKYPAAQMPAGVAFTNGSGAYGAYIAEHMMACILSLYRQLPHYAALQRQHIWDNCWQEGTLEGKTVLILGPGGSGPSTAGWWACAAAPGLCRTSTRSSGLRRWISCCPRPTWWPACCRAPGRRRACWTAGGSFL